MDGDDYHSSESVGKMSQGQPLTDLVRVLLLVMSDLLALQSFGQERLPWLQSLHGVLYEWARAEDSKEEEGRGEEEGGRVCGVRVCGVLVCSALKRSYRDILIGRGQGERGRHGGAMWRVVYTLTHGHGTIIYPLVGLPVATCKSCVVSTSVTLQCIPAVQYA